MIFGKRKFFKDDPFIYIFLKILVLLFSKNIYIKELYNKSILYFDNYCYITISQSKTDIYMIFPGSDLYNRYCFQVGETNVQLPETVCGKNV